MSDLIKGFTHESLQHKIEYEGFDYFFTSYISYDDILDADLREALIEFLDAREKLIAILEDNGIDTDA